MIEIYGLAYIQSSLDLEALGQVLSEKIFGGLPFGGKDRGIMDEVPAIFIEPRFLGLQIVLYRTDPSGFALKVSSFDFWLDTVIRKGEKDPIRERVEIFDHLVELLRSHGFDAKSGEIA